MNQTFEHPLTVTARDIDELKHVNNEVYLRWLIESATAHSESLGYTMEKWIGAGAAFVVRRHELDYLAPAFDGERLSVRTWVGSMEKSSSVREYEIVRPKDGRTLLRGKTLWVYIDLQTGRPKAIPAEMIEKFRPFFHSASESR